MKCLGLRPFHLPSNFRIVTSRLRNYKVTSIFFRFSGTCTGLCKSIITRFSRAIELLKPKLIGYRYLKFLCSFKSIGLDELISFVESGDNSLDIHSDFF